MYPRRQKRGVSQPTAPCTENPPARAHHACPYLAKATLSEQCLRLLEAPPHARGSLLRADLLKRESAWRCLLAAVPETAPRIPVVQLPARSNSTHKPTASWW